jgi:glutathione S-transferase
MSRAYALYGFELSYFTRKMEAALRLYGLPFRRRSKNLLNWRRLERLSGCRKVPVVVTPDGRVLSDTTPIIDHLDAELPARRLFPGGVDGIVVRLVEEWLDEWFPRTVLHFRWQHPDSAGSASWTIAREVAPWLPAPLRRPLRRRIASWGDRACRAFGLDDVGERHAAEADATAVWQALDHQLGETRWALGNRPTAVDAVLLGALRGHYLADPAPRRLMERWPRVLDWAGRADDWDGGGEPPPFPECTGFATTVLERMAGPYQSWMLAYAAAVDRGERSFTAKVGGRQVRFRTQRPPGPAASRRRLVERLHRGLNAGERREAAAWLAGRGLAELVPIDGDRHGYQPQISVSSGDAGRS